MIVEENKENWEIGRVINKTEKTASIQKWKVVEEGPEKEFFIEEEENSTLGNTKKRHKIDVLKDVTNWVRYKSGR